MESRSCSKEQLEPSCCCWTASLFPSDYWIIQSLGKQGARLAMLITHKISQHQIYQRVIHHPLSAWFCLASNTLIPTCAALQVVSFVHNVPLQCSVKCSYGWLKHNRRSNGRVSFSKRVQTLDSWEIKEFKSYIPSILGHETFPSSKIPLSSLSLLTRSSGCGRANIFQLICELAPHSSKGPAEYRGYGKSVQCARYIHELYQFCMLLWTSLEKEMQGNSSLIQRVEDQSLYPPDMSVARLQPLTAKE